MSQKPRVWIPDQKNLGKQHARCANYQRADRAAYLKEVLGALGLFLLFWAVFLLLEVIR